ncbi:MAG: ATPase domain-containing protein [Chloroflexota bacterium]
MQKSSPDRLSTGVPGLDEVLHGGFIPQRAYMVRGRTGTGKTTLGAHYLAAGAANSEKALFVTFSESEAEIRRDAEERGIDLKNVDCLDLSPTAEPFTQMQTYNVFEPAEVEREPTTRAILERVEAVKPRRVFVDALTQFRYLTRDVFAFRRQVLSFLRYLVDQGATVLFSSEYSPETPDDDLQFISACIIDLAATAQERTVGVIKYHGSDYQSGRHALRLTDRGMVVYPRLVPEAYRRAFAAELLPSGVPELDELLGGGIGRGSVVVISGPSGVGKTSIGLQFAKEAAGRGERSVVYSFEESVDSIIRRSEGINMPVKAMVSHGTLALVPIEPLRYVPDEFASIVREEVEQRQATTIMLDSTRGYTLSLRGEDLIAHLHALARYLSNRNVTTLLISETEYITGEFRATEAGISYLADDIIFLRYFEYGGELHKAIGVLKKRTGDFEKSLRELAITRYGIKVGKPMTGFQGILRGVPQVIPTG